MFEPPKRQLAIATCLPTDIGNLGILPTIVLLPNYYEPNGNLSSTSLQNVSNGAPIQKLVRIG